VESGHSLLAALRFGTNISMAKDDYAGEAVAVGEWLYDGTVPKTAEVVAYDCDFFFERIPTDDGRADWAPHPLNEEGVLYYLRVDGELLPLPPFESVVEAIAWADRQPWAPITWRDEPG
jgi:hypothetical protein